MIGTPNGPSGLLGLLLVAACLVAGTPGARGTSPPPPPAPASTPPPPEQGPVLEPTPGPGLGPAAPWDGGPSATAGELAKPVLNELVSGPQVEQQDKTQLALQPAVRPAQPPTGAPGDSISTTTPTGSAAVGKRRPSERPAVAERGPRLVSAEQAEQGANAVASRPSRPRPNRVPDVPEGTAGDDADDGDEVAVDGGAAGVTKRPRVRISVRRGARLNATTTVPPLPPPAATLTPTKEADWKPTAVEDNGLPATEQPAVTPGTPPPTVAVALGDKVQLPEHPRRGDKDPGEMMELSSVSPLQRSRLSTLRWRHPQRGSLEESTTTDLPKRIRHRETPWEGSAGPASTSHRPIVRRGSVKFGNGSAGAGTPSHTTTSTSTSTAPTLNRTLEEDMAVPETAYAWSLAAMKGPAPKPETPDGAQGSEGAVPVDVLSVTTASPPIVIEVSTLPDLTPAHAQNLSPVPNKESSNEPVHQGSLSTDKKVSSNMMLDAEPHLPLESVFSMGRPPTRPPSQPAAPAPNSTGENLVVQPQPAEVMVKVEPTRGAVRVPTRGPTSTPPTHINAVPATDEDDDDEDDDGSTSASNIHVVDPPDLATAPADPAAPIAPALPSTPTSATTTTSGRPDLWRPVQPVQPVQPAISNVAPTTSTPSPTPGMVEYFTFAPSASSPSGSGPASAPSSPSAPDAGTAASSPSASGPDQDDDLVASSPALPTSMPGEEIAVSTLSPDDVDDDDPEEPLSGPGSGPGLSPDPGIHAVTMMPPRLAPTTPGTVPGPPAEDDDMPEISTRPPPAVATVIPDVPDDVPLPGVLDNTTMSPADLEPTTQQPDVTPVTAASPAPTTRTAPPPPPPTSTPAVPATSPSSAASPDTSEPLPLPTATPAATTDSLPTPAVSPPVQPTRAETTTPPSPSTTPTTPTTPTPTPTPTPDDEQSVEMTTSPSGEEEETPEPQPSPTPEPAPAYLRLLMETDWAQFCQEVEAFKQAAAALMTNGTTIRVQASQVVLLNVGPTHCSEAADEARAEETTTTEMPNASVNPIANMISIQMYIADSALHFSRNLTEDFLRFWGCRGLEYPIRKVDLVLQPLGGADGGSSGQGSGAGVIAAIAISCVAAACLLVLAALLLIMRKRQKSLSYGQRCTPVSLDAYSLDSVSVCNSSSVRRKGAANGARASKRSYGNPAFSDPAAPSHPLTFPALSNMSTDRPSVESEFTAIPQVAPKADELPDGADTKNRYANVIPLPETRVTLSCRDGDPLSQYINANYVRGPKNTDKFYIACQAPLPSTIHDFWRMVWETQARVILMLTDLVEDGVEKCADYLPPSEVTDCHRLYGDFQVTLKKREVKDKYVVSCIQLKNMETNLWREATHMWYMGWPSRGVPDDPSTIIAFLIEARAFMRSPTSSSSGSTGNGAAGGGARQGGRNAGIAPSIVHCSPGTGRTGTVLAVDLCIREFETTRQVDIPRTVYRLRKDRAGCVQTKEQYMFIYKALSLYATKLTGGALDSI